MHDKFMECVSPLHNYAEMNLQKTHVFLCREYLFIVFWLGARCIW